MLICSTETSSDETAALSPTEAPVQTVSSAKSSPAELVETLQEDSPVDERFLLPAEHHPWAHFPVGAWREIQTTTENFDEAGVVVSQSLTTQMENLQSVSPDRYALNVQATVDVVGKRVAGNWITRVLNMTTDDAGQIIETRRQEDQVLTLTNQDVNCQVWDVLHRDDARTLVDHILYSPEQYPHVLRRETAEVASPDGDPRPSEQAVNIVAVEIPYLLGDQVLQCTCLRTTRQGDKGSTVKITLVSEQVPGGEVAVWTTDFDAQGKRARWSSQELLGYGMVAVTESPATRRELRRARRRSK